MPIWWVGEESTAWVMGIIHFVFRMFFLVLGRIGEESDKMTRMPEQGYSGKGILCVALDFALEAEQDTDEVYARITLVPEQDDTNKETPTQELIAKDLHGREWPFKHIFRGQPRRHLLATGWSAFVTSKRLVVGDSFVFLRGENGELRVGVRRAARQQCTMPSSVISSQSTHLRDLAAASHAVATRTFFVVSNKPRFTGTIVGVEDLSAHWENSKWRSLRKAEDEELAARLLEGSLKVENG
ncbi:hypothetical protein RHMOL_Rhmol02G0305900 [Rhododendron molle]|uniref:Uncharacterized protein n=1 Tax=Rhododendron molle TaxID=49168 RepID=A0ACC0PYG4_RHOML|nr:hypothetical protein RHMOL_Rhmol02G0305900 [Rhododendron molle]